MDFKKAKLIDQWVGTPMCFFFSLADFFYKVFSSRKNPLTAPPQRILFIGLAEMGSNILAFGAVEELKKDFPKAEIFFLVFSENREAVTLLGNIEEKNVFSIRNANLGTLFVDTLKFVDAVRREKIDAVIDMELFSRYSSILAYLSGAKIRAGFHGYSIPGLYRGGLQTHRVLFNPHKHISKNFVSLAKALTADPSEDPLYKGKEDSGDFPAARLFVDEVSRNLAWERLQQESPGITRRHKIVLIHPDLATRLPLRRWPLENYLALAQRLLEDPDVCVLSVGIGCDAVKLGVEKQRYIDCIGKTSLREFIDLCSVAKVLVSHDSGAVHLASITGVAIVAMFGPETPLLYGPLNPNRTVISRELFCSPCFSPFNNRTSSCRNNLCMQEITVDEVFQAVRHELDRK